MEDAEIQLFNASIPHLASIEGTLVNLKKRVPGAIKYAKSEVKRAPDDAVWKGLLKAFIGVGKVLPPTRKAVEPVMKLAMTSAKKFQDLKAEDVRKTLFKSRKTMLKMKVQIDVLNKAIGAFGGDPPAGTSPGAIDLRTSIMNTDAFLVYYKKFDVKAARF